MTKYKYVVNYDDIDYEIEDTRKAKTLEDAYNFMCKWYVQEKYEDGFKTKKEFYEKYPFDEVKKQIVAHSYFNFMYCDDIQTMEFYVNNFLKEVY